MTNSIRISTNLGGFGFATEDLLEIKVTERVFKSLYSPNQYNHKLIETVKEEYYYIDNIKIIKG